MNELMKGVPVGKAILESLKIAGTKTDRLYNLAIVRMGDKEEDLSYERAIMKKAALGGIKVSNVVLKEKISVSEASKLIESLNQDPDIDGVLVFRPMLNKEVEDMICSVLAADKDIDGITQASMAGVYMGKKYGFPPCTAEACIKMLDYYGIDIAGKKAAVIGRSMVIGKPVAMLLLERDATVTICHSKTENLKEIVKSADIVIAAIGQKGFLTDEYVRNGQIIIDVGINFDSHGNISGDVDTSAVADIVRAVSPVPGGIGEITTALLLMHVVEAGDRKVRKDRI